MHDLWALHFLILNWFWQERQQCDAYEKKCSTEERDRYEFVDFIELSDQPEMHNVDSYVFIFTFATRQMNLHLTVSPPNIVGWCDKNALSFSSACGQLTHLSRLNAPNHSLNLEQTNWTASRIQRRGRQLWWESASKRIVWLPWEAL